MINTNDVRIGLAHVVEVTLTDGTPWEFHAFQHDDVWMFDYGEDSWIPESTPPEKIIKKLHYDVVYIMIGDKPLACDHISTVDGRSYWKGHS